MAKKNASKTPNLTVVPPVAQQQTAPAPVAKPKCGLTPEEFLAAAQQLAVQVLGGGTVVAEPKQFSTGSFGWGIASKVTVTVGGKPVQVQFGGNLVVVGSKPGA